MPKKYYLENAESLPAIVFTEIAPAGFTEIIDENKLIELHKKRYETNRKNGGEYLDKVKSELYLSILNETNTDVEVFAFEEHLAHLFKHISEGSWLSASQALDGLTLSGIFDEESKTKFKTDINNYLAENY
jgi:hypothetical protein